jgi:hypothetical protein
MFNSQYVTRPFIASGDLSGLQYRIVDLVAGNFNKVGHALADTGFGVLLNKPQNGEHATVAVQGQVQVRVGAAVTVGSYAASAASGWALASGIGFADVASGSDYRGKQVLGRFVTAAASGMLAVVDLAPFSTLVAST